jgi:predicted dehydrogenase
LALKNRDGGAVVRIGIIGAGRYAATHMQAFAALADAKVAAACRRDSEALQSFQRKWDVTRGFSDYRELLASEEIDAVTVITPPDTHFEIASLALAAGKHVLCEKPLSLHAEQAKELWRGAELVVNFNQRGRTPVGVMKRYLDDGYVGDICHVNIWWGLTFQYDMRPEISSWRFRPDTGGGTIYEMIHTFDFARFLCGDIRRICGIAATSEPFRRFADVPAGMKVQVPDSSAFLLEFASGATGVLHTSFLTRGIGPSGKSEPRVEVTGTRGRLVTFDGNRLMGIRDRQGPLDDLPQGDPYAEPCRQFIWAITKKGEAKCDFYEGFKAAEIVDAALLSVAERRWVTLA